MHDETRTIIVGALGFAIGVSVGIAAGLLVAPQSGAQTRRQLQNLAEDLKESASVLADEAQKIVGNVVAESKRLVT
jgi:gas vesicle protein